MRNTAQHLNITYNITYNRIKEVKEMKIEELEKTLTSLLEEVKNLKGKEGKKKVKKAEENVKTYKDIPEILRSMSHVENVKRFGLLWNAENPYNIPSKAIEKFYNDYNIQAFRKWYMSYDNKDIIIDKQLEKHPKARNKNIKRRIEVLKQKIHKEYKNKTANQIEKIKEHLENHIKKLEGELKNGQTNK